MTFLSNIWLNSKQQYPNLHARTKSFQHFWRGMKKRDMQWGPMGRPIEPGRGYFSATENVRWQNRRDAVETDGGEGNQNLLSLKLSPSPMSWVDWVFFPNVQDSQTSFQIIWFITAHNRFEKRIEQKRTKRKMVKGVMGEKSKLKFFLGQLRI